MRARQALGLKLLTPASFLKAISEGSDPAAADKSAIDRQLAGRQIKVWVFNSQNVTPDVQRVNEIVRAAKIPIATVTETLSPANASFQEWQTGQLQRLAVAQALHAVDGVFHSDQFRAKHGRLPAFTTEARPGTRSGSPTRLALFLFPYDQSYCVSIDLRPALQAFVPRA